MNPLAVYGLVIANSASPVEVADTGLSGSLPTMKACDFVHSREGHDSVHVSDNIDRENKEYVVEK